MRYLKLFEDFITESDEVLAGEDSKVTVKSVITNDGTTITAEEILGVVVASNTEGEVESYFYDKYGEGSFSIEAMSSIKQSFNDFAAEQAEKEKDEEDDAAAPEGGDGAEGGEEAGDELDLDI